MYVSKETPNSRILEPSEPMAGRPKLRKLEARIEEEGGDDVILDRIATGEKMRLIAADYDCSPRLIYQWRDRSKERKAAWLDARKIAAHGMAEEAIDIVDEAKPTTSAEATMIKERAGNRKWLAELWNREEYGAGKQVLDVNLNVGDLHLAALTAGGAHPTPQIEQEIPEAEIEILPSDGEIDVEEAEVFSDDEEDELYGLVED